MPKKNKNNKNKSENKKKLTRLCYSKEHLAVALEEIHNGKRISEVSRKYNIPESTIRAKKLGIYANKKPGPAPVLTAEEETDLVNWIFCCCEKGFPVTKAQLLESVRVICVNLKKKNSFVNNTPGRSWYDGFLKRHPDIVQRISEKISLNRAKVSEYSLRNWFKEVSQHFIHEGIISMEANRVFNCDKTGINNS